MPDSRSGMPCRSCRTCTTWASPTSMRHRSYRPAPAARMGMIRQTIRRLIPSWARPRTTRSCARRCRAMAWARCSISCPTTWGWRATPTSGGAMSSKTARPHPMPASSTLPGMTRHAWRCMNACCSRFWGRPTARLWSPRRSACSLPPGPLPSTTLSTACRWRPRAMLSSWNSGVRH